MIAALAAIEHLAGITEFFEAQMQRAAICIRARTQGLPRQ